jgi:hypothetical protein
MTKGSQSCTQQAVRAVLRTSVSQALCVADSVADIRPETPSIAVVDAVVNIIVASTVEALLVTDAVAQQGCSAGAAAGGGHALAVVVVAGSYVALVLTRVVLRPPIRAAISASVTVAVVVVALWQETLRVADTVAHD